MRLKHIISAIIAVLCVAAFIFVGKFAFSPVTTTSDSDADMTITAPTEDTTEAETHITPMSPEKTPTNEKNEVAAKAPSENTPAKEEDKTPIAAEPKAAVCTISIRCDAIFKSEHKLSHEKLALLPSDGIILPKTTVELKDGDTAFDVLLRETKKHKIHFEFENTPMYKSSYIEGISNLYEFDCGELSGWLFSVNGKFSEKAASSYVLNDGDVVSFVYSCDLGRDVGGYVPEA